MKWGAVGHGWFVVVAMALPGCRFEDRTLGGARRDDTSVQALADGFYAALALRDTAALSRTTYGGATALVAGGRNPSALVPIRSVLGVPDRRTTAPAPRIVRTELRPDGVVASARVMIASRTPDGLGEIEATDFLTLARVGDQWRVAHVIFGPWRMREMP